MAALTTVITARTQCVVEQLIDNSRARAELRYSVG